MHALLLAAALAGAAASQVCLQGFDAQRDYFPAKYDVQHATGYTLKYSQYYKVLNVSGQVFVLSACGTPTPTRDEIFAAPSDEVHFWTTPVTGAALLSTTQIPFMELLGLRSSVAAVSGGSLVNSACIQSELAAGRIVDVLAADGYSTDVAALEATAADVFFCTAGWGCPGTTRDVPVADNSETSALAVADWLGFYAAFFDKEAEAVAVRDTIVSRYSCNQRMVADALAAMRSRGNGGRVRTLWAYLYDGLWFTVRCPHYACEIVTAAGGDLIAPAAPGSGLYGGYTHEEFAAFAQQADVWLYANDNWATAVAPSLNATAAGADAGVAAVLSRIPAVASRDVVDLTKSGVNAWFELRLAQPDALLQDIISVLHPDAYALIRAYVDAAGSTPLEHARVWWRNVFTEAQGAAPAPSTCTDAAAALQLQSTVCPAITLGAAGGASGQAAADDADAARAKVIGGAVGGTVAVLVAAAVLVAVLKAKAAAAASAASVAKLASTNPISVAV